MKGIAHYLAILALSLLSVSGFARDDGLANGILDIQHEWERVHYLLPEDKQDAAFSHAEEMTDALVKRYPGRAEPLVWKAIVLSSHAGVRSDLRALNMTREARDFLERAEKIDPGALDGSIYATLGNLYYRVPGWPLGYGDDKKAEAFLKKALAINPDDMDANYFYGEFLSRRGLYPEALSALEKAMHAPGHPNRPLADEGRRKEVQAVIARIKNNT